jgi:hypothetical protein
MLLTSWCKLVSREGVGRGERGFFEIGEPGEFWINVGVAMDCTGEEKLPFCV